MKEFQINHIHRGVQFKVFLCAKTKNDACKLLDISMYQLNNYGYTNEPRTAECIQSAYVKFAMFDSGELIYAKPEWRNKLIKYTDLVNFIDELRKVCKSYNETIKHYSFI